MGELKPTTLQFQRIKGLSRALGVVAQEPGGSGLANSPRLKVPHDRLN